MGDEEKKAAKAFNEHNMSECFYKFNELVENDDQLPLDQLQDGIDEVENDFHDNLRITLFDTQANLEYEFFIDNEEFEGDTKEAEELFLAVKEYDDNSSYY